MRLQDSFDSGLINEDGAARFDSPFRPSIHYSWSSKRNEKMIQLDRKPLFRNTYRYLCRFWFCLSGNTKYKRSIRKRTSRFGVNSRSELDVFARIVFPVSFVLFNILYWFYFIHFQR